MWPFGKRASRLEKLNNKFGRKLADINNKLEELGSNVIGNGIGIDVLKHNLGKCYEVRKYAEQDVPFCGPYDLDNYEVIGVYKCSEYSFGLYGSVFNLKGQLNILNYKLTLHGEVVSKDTLDSKYPMYRHNVYPDGQHELGLEEIDPEKYEELRTKFIKEYKDSVN